MPDTLIRFIWQQSAQRQMLLCVLSTAVFLLTAVPLELQRRIVNMLNEGGSFGQLSLFCSLYLAIVLVQGGLKYWMNFLRGMVGEETVRHLRRRIRRQRSSRSEPIDEGHGTEVTMVSSEVEPVGGFVGEAVSVPVVNAGILATVMGYMLVIEPLIAVVGLAVFVPQTALVPIIQRRLNRRAKQRIEILRDVGDGIVGDAANGQDGTQRTYDECFDAIYRLRIGIFRLKFGMKFLINLLNHTATLVTLFVGGWLVLEGQTEIGTIVAFISGIERLGAPWRELVAYFRTASDVRVKYHLIRDSLTG